MPTEILRRIYSYLPFLTAPWCRRTLLLSRDPLVQIRTLIAELPVTVTETTTEPSGAAALLTHRLDFDHPALGAAFQRLGATATARSRAVVRRVAWDDSHEALTLVVIQLILKCQELNRLDLIKCLCPHGETVPLAAIDAGTAIGRTIIADRAAAQTDNNREELAATLMYVSLSRHNDRAALAVLDIPAFAHRKSAITTLCAAQAFHLGRSSAFIALVDRPELDRDQLDIFLRRRAMVHEPAGSSGIFIYCVENAVLTRSIWSCAPLWNDISEIATYVAEHPGVVPSIPRACVDHMLRVARGRLAPNTVAQILVDLAVDIELLWVEHIEPPIVRCPHLLEEVELYVWIYLLAGGQSFTRKRLRALIEKVNDARTFPWSASSEWWRMMIAEIEMKVRLYYRKPGGRAIFNDEEMWWPTSKRTEDLDYY